MTAKRGALHPIVMEFLTGNEASIKEVFAHVEASGLSHTRITVASHLYDGTLAGGPYRRTDSGRYTREVTS